LSQNNQGPFKELNYSPNYHYLSKKKLVPSFMSSTALLNARSNAAIRVAISYSFDFAFTKRS
jgi:hypothetical protein